MHVFVAELMSPLFICEVQASQLLEVILVVVCMQKLTANMPYLYNHMHAPFSLVFCLKLMPNVLFLKV